MDQGVEQVMNKRFIGALSPNGYFVHQAATPVKQRMLTEQEVLAMQLQEQVARQQALLHAQQQQQGQQQTPLQAPQQVSQQVPQIQPKKGTQRVTRFDPVVRALENAESETSPPKDGGSGVQGGGPVITSSGLNENNESLNQTRGPLLTSVLEEQIMLERILLTLLIF